MNRKRSKPRLSETLSALADEFVARLDRLHKAGDINDNAAECLGGLSRGDGEPAEGNETPGEHG